MTAAGWYDIEAGYDYLYGEYSTDGGETWQRAGAPIDGTSRGWENLSWCYRPGGKATLFRFRYQTDGGVNEAGAFLDTIVVTADRTVETDGVEGGTDGWDAKGWSISTGTGRQADQAVLPAGEPRVRRLRQDAAGGAVQLLRGRRAAQLGGVLPLPGRHAGVVRRQGVGRQQHQRSTRVTGRPCRSTPGPSRSTTATAPSRATGGSRSTPRSASQTTDPVCLHKQVLVGNGANASVKTIRGVRSVRRRASREFNDSSETAYYSDGTTRLVGLDDDGRSGMRATVLSESGGQHHRPGGQPAEVTPDGHAKRPAASSAAGRFRVTDR